MFEHGASPQSPVEWFALATRQVAVARTLLGAKHTVAAWSHAGFAVECALKAAIMSRERMNRWPAKHERPDLHTHELNALMRLAGIDRQSLRRDPVAPRWMTVLMWTRGESYNHGAMPVRLAQDMCVAAFGPEGVLPWIAKRYRLDI